MLSEVLYPNGLVLISETTVGLCGLNANLEKTKVTLSKGIVEHWLCRSKCDSCWT